MKFDELGIIEPILRTIDFEKPTEIQEKAIPLVIAGKDVIAQSSTGSGKTFVFATGIIQNIEKGHGLQVLIMTPTRELALQVSDDLKRFSQYKKLNLCSVYGGVSISPQIRDLRFADVVIGTPGRILDHLERRTIDLSKVRILVLDEADRMLDMGFIDSVKQIIRFCPQNRQTLLFSATLAGEIRDLARNYMKDPVRVNAKDNVDPTLLTQVYYDVQDGMKFSLLVHLLKNETAKLAMVFCNTKRMVDSVAKNLKKQGIDAIAIHGGLSQAKRTQTLDQFHKKGASVLVCTDVASRGLDIPEVSHVYNYDTPNDSKEYTHRIGRTARAGKEGKAINLIATRDHDSFSAVLRETKHTITKEAMIPFEKVQIEMQERRRSGYGRRPQGGKSRSERRERRY
jgi:ATP-dependent RNA helicase DeaD